jgi:voltage-gated potassium channel Kch
LPIIARTRSLDELEALRAARVGAVIVGEMELALEMAAHALRRVGVPDDVAEQPVLDLRRRVELRYPRQGAAIAREDWSHR